MFSWMRESRRQQLLAQAFPREWNRTLDAHVRHWKYLDGEKRRRIEGFAQVLLAEKDWAGGSGFELTEEMRVTIAGYAGVMTLGMVEPYYFDRLKTIIVYPGTYLPSRSRFDQYSGDLFLTARLGEAWHYGPIVLSWAEIAGPKRSRPGNNLVFHEFAHHIDGLDGDVDGTPPIVGRTKSRAWIETAEREFERLRTARSNGEKTLLDPYGAANRAEFFAVASECFFERPRAMRAQHGDLYAALADFYCQDVAAWLSDAEIPASANDRVS